MSVWISDEKLLIFASLISPSKMILFEKKYQTFDTVFHHQMKHLEVRQKYSAARRIFNSLLGVSCISCLIYYIILLSTTLITCSFEVLCLALVNFSRLITVNLSYNTNCFHQLSKRSN